MIAGHRFSSSFLLAAVLALPLIVTGCSASASYRTYDPYYHDYHRWDDHERVYYQQWTVENHNRTGTIASWTTMNKSNIGTGATATVIMTMTIHEGR